MVGGNQGGGVTGFGKDAWGGKANNRAPKEGAGGQFLGGQGWGGTEGYKPGLVESVTDGGLGAGPQKTHN